MTKTATKKARQAALAAARATARSAMDTALALGDKRDALRKTFGHDSAEAGAATLAYNAALSAWGDANFKLKMAYL